MSRIRRYLIDVLAYLDVLRRGEGARVATDDATDDETMRTWLDDLDRKGRAILHHIDTTDHNSPNTEE